MRGLIILALWMVGTGVTNVCAQIDLDIISQIESSGGKQIYNRRSGAYSEMQITPICLRDYNQVKKKSLRRGDLRDQKIARRIAKWYFEERAVELLKANKIKATKENILAVYNGGHRRVIEGNLAKENIDYIRKYKRIENRRKYIK